MTTVLTGGLRENQALLIWVRKIIWCAIRALKTRFFALDSLSLVMDFRTKQHSKRSCRTPSVRCEVSALGWSITGKYNGELPLRISPTRGGGDKKSENLPPPTFDQILGSFSHNIPWTEFYYGEILIWAPPRCILPLFSLVDHLLHDALTAFYRSVLSAVLF